MRADHLALLAPVCPACQAAGREAAPLRLGTAAVEVDGDVREGALLCTDALCQREHPIVDGIPIVVSDIGSWLSHQLDAVLAREDLSAYTRSLLGDATGAGTPYERDRMHVSSYAYSHYEAGGGFTALAAEALDLLDGAPQGTWLDTGCAVGGATVELARRGVDLAVGVDLSFAVLRMAERVRRTGVAAYELRRVGLVYDEREVAVEGVGAERLSYWCADVTALPFGDGAFAGALSLNVLDCVPSPLGHLSELGRVLAPGASALMSTPYDWSSNATPPAAWIGGHSQRAEHEGSSSSELRRILGGGAGVDTGLHVGAERGGLKWKVRSHERMTVEYALDLLRLDRG